MYQIGQMVRSRVNAQQLDKGEIYIVVNYTTKRTFLGTFTKYFLISENGDLKEVGNGHIVLEAVT